MTSHLPTTKSNLSAPLKAVQSAFTALPLKGISSSCKFRRLPMRFGLRDALNQARGRVRIACRVLLELDCCPANWPGPADDWRPERSTRHLMVGPRSIRYTNLAADYRRFSSIVPTSIFLDGIRPSMSISYRRMPGARPTLCIETVGCMFVLSRPIRENLYIHDLIQ